MGAKSIGNLVKAFELGKLTKDVELQRESSDLLAKIYITEGNYKLALNQTTLASQLKDSIVNTDLKMKISSLKNKKELNSALK